MHIKYQTEKLQCKNKQNLTPIFVKIFLNVSNVLKYCMYCTNCKYCTNPKIHTLQSIYFLM